MNQPGCYRNVKDTSAIASVAFTGVAPYTFNYSINGVVQGEITTTNNPYTIETNEGGIYNLISFSDAVEQGGLSGQAFVTIQDAPVADFKLSPNETYNIRKSK